MRDPEFSGFLRSGNDILARHGQPLSQESFADLFDLYNDISFQDGSTKLPHDTAIGRYVSLRTEHGQCVVATEFSMLNESSGMMPETEVLGAVIGHVEFDIRDAELEDKMFNSTVWLSGFIYGGGVGKWTNNDLILDNSSRQAFESACQIIESMGQTFSLTAEGWEPDISEDPSVQMRLGNLARFIQQSASS